MSHTRAEVPGKIDRMTRFVTGLDESSDAPTFQHEDFSTGNLSFANLLTSEPADPFIREAGMHAPVIDLDFPCELIPSSTEGHFHLVLDRLIPAEAYFTLLDAMVAAGLVEPGYAGSSRSRGYSAIRLPWIKKGAPRRGPGGPLTPWQSDPEEAPC